jgi:uncharacterized protein with PQ loop repeat
MIFLIYTFIMMFISFIVFLIYSIKLKYKKLSYIILICCIINLTAFFLTLVEIL